MGLFGKKEEQGEVYKVYSEKPADTNNERVIYAPTREEAERQAEQLRQKESWVKVKKV
jgi:hypothetical protein